MPTTTTTRLDCWCMSTGPHIFNTNSVEVFDYLSRFIDWRPYQHRVRAPVDDQMVPLPINLDTINRPYGLNLTSFQLDGFCASVAEPRPRIRTSEDVIVSRVGRPLFDKFFQYQAPAERTRTFMSRGGSLPAGTTTWTKWWGSLSRFTRSRR